MDFEGVGMAVTCSAILIPPIYPAIKLEGMVKIKADTVAIGYYGLPTTLINPPPPK